MGSMVVSQVIKGMDVVRILENVEMKSKIPAKLCIIAKCRELKEGDDWGISQKMTLVTVIQIPPGMQV